MTKTITKSPKCATPFLRPPWPWNHTPREGVVTRPRCQQIVNDAEREAGAKIIAEFREHEALAAANDIAHKQSETQYLKGVALELKQREIRACDHAIFERELGELARLREEAFLLVTPVFRRLIQSLDDELNAAALESERRLDAAGLPIKSGSEWLAHEDILCAALWSRRDKAEKTFAVFQERRDGIGAAQYFLTSEEHVPFSW